MISLASGLRIYLACRLTDMRKGMAGLAMLVQQSLVEDPFSGVVYAFRGRRAGLIKLIWHDGVGLTDVLGRMVSGRTKANELTRCCRGIGSHRESRSSHHWRRSQRDQSPHRAKVHLLPLSIACYPRVRSSRARAA